MGRRAILLFAILLLFPVAAGAQELRVELITVGPGEAVWERFGHNELLFINTSTGESVTFDWGRFDFDQPNFIGRFIRGEMLYSSGSDGGDVTLAFYERIGRRVERQELRLTQPQAWALLRACEVAYLPKNRHYRYDYFIGNCSTELRDALDQAIGGQVKAQLGGVAAGTTFRREVNRHFGSNWPLWFGVHVALSGATDRPIDAWEHTFLPAELRDWVQQVTVTIDGQQVPLASAPVLSSQGRFAPVPANPPSRWWQTGLIGVVWALGMLAAVNWGYIWLARALAALWYLFAGVAGAFMLGFWGLTGHWAAYANQNLLLLSPLALLLLLPTLLGRWPSLSLWMAAGHLGLCAAGTILSLTPAGQQNGEIVLLALPANLAAAWVSGLRRLGSWKPAVQNPAPAAA